MFKKIKEFFVGKPKEVAVEAPYKTEAANESVLTVVPAGTEASVAAPTQVAPVTLAVEGAGAVEAPAEKPVKAKKTPAAKKAPAAKKPRAPKKPKAE
jgi:hypothetical protein